MKGNRFINMPHFFVELSTVCLEKTARRQHVSPCTCVSCQEASFCETLRVFLLKERITWLYPPRRYTVSLLSCSQIFTSESAFRSAGFCPSGVLLGDGPVADKQHDRDKWPRWCVNTGQSRKLCNLNPSLLRLCQQSPRDVWFKEEVVEKRC